MSNATERLEDDRGFVTDMARFAEGVLTERQVKKRWRFDDADWEELGADDALVEKIEAEKIRRIRDGSAKRERAQLEIIDGPPILGKIMRDPNANERHRIDSIKALDSLATANGTEAAAAGQLFQITINLSADGSDHVEHFSKPLTINHHDADPADGSGTAPRIEPSKDERGRALEALLKHC